MQKAFTLVTICFALFLLWVIYLANTGQPSIFFDFIRQIPNGDKIGHVLLFGFLTFGAIIATGFKCFRLFGGKLTIYWGAAGVLVFVIAEELTQQFFPSRTMDIKDLIADAMGIAVFTLLAFAFKRSRNINRKRH